MIQLSILIINLIITIYKLQFAKIDPESIELEEFLKNCRTGDIIAFKAVDNFNALMHGSYFTHLGIVYCSDDSGGTGAPYLFEADHYHMKSGKSGILLSDLKTRILTYKGHAYHYKLKNELTDDQISDLKEFISYSLENMQYQKSLVKFWAKKYLGYNCVNETNCAELVFLTFIKIGLLDIKHYDSFISNYIKWIFRYIESCGYYHPIKGISINRYGAAITR